MALSFIVEWGSAEDQADVADALELDMTKQTIAEEDGGGQASQSQDYGEGH